MRCRKCHEVIYDKSFCGKCLCEDCCEECDYNTGCDYIFQTALKMAKEVEQGKRPDPFKNGVGFDFRGQQ
jgi:hypothetical protein